MKKTTFILCAVIFSAGFAGEIGFSQSTIAGPRIVHEEEEITVFDDGKETEKYFVGKHGEQKNAIMKDAHDKKRKIKVKEVQQPKLKFYDENGNVIKEINLSSEKSKGRIKETRPRYVKGEFDAETDRCVWCGAVGVQRACRLRAGAERCHRDDRRRGA